MHGGSTGDDVIEITIVRGEERFRLFVDDGPLGIYTDQSPFYDPI
jgi:hypothetical protein